MIHLITKRYVLYRTGYNHYLHQMKKMVVYSSTSKTRSNGRGICTAYMRRCQDVICIFVHIAENPSRITFNFDRCQGLVLMQHKLNEVPGPLSRHSLTSAHVFLCVCLPVCLSVCLCVCVSAYLCVYLSVRLSVCPSVCLLFFLCL